MSKIIRTLLNDSILNLGVFFLALAIVCPLSSLFIFLPLWLFTQGHISDWLLGVFFLVFLVVLIGGIAALTYGVWWHRARWLDSVFNPLSLSGKPYLINGREYTGAFRGRTVTARFSRGPRLELAVQTSVMTRFGIAEHDQPGLFLAELASKQPLRTGSPALQGMRVFALDEGWTARVLSDTQADAPLLRLMRAGETWALIRQVLLVPGSLQLVLYRNRNVLNYSFTTEEVHAWLNDLAALANLMEEFPAPAVTSQESRVEAAVRTGTATRRAVWFLLGLFLLCGLGVAAVIMAGVGLSSFG